METLFLHMICSSQIQGVPGIEIHTITGDHDYSDRTSARTGYNSRLPSDANTSAFEARLDLLRNGRDPTNSLPHVKVVRI